MGADPVNIVPTVCPYGCRYFNDGWHAENCPGPPKKAGPEDTANWRSTFERPARPFPPVFRDEPEYQREREADDLERRREEAEDVRTIYPERGITE
jgi:hypothetical protein